MPSDLPSGSTPNYAARRAVVLGALVAVFAGAVVAALLVTSGDDEQAADTPSWDAIVVVDDATGAVEVHDATGELETSAAATGRVSDVHVNDDRLALVGAGQVTLVDLGDGSTQIVALDDDMQVARVPNGRTLTLVAAPAGGGHLVLIDGEGTLTDVAEAASLDDPLLYPDSVRSDSTGTAFAIADGRNFQTVVIRATEPAVTFFPGIPMALSDELVVTSQNVGASAELGVFDADGERRTTVASERPAGGVLDGERFVYVSESGGVFVATPDDDEPERIGTVVVPPGDTIGLVAPVLDGTRLVVAGSEFQALLDLEGKLLHQTTFTSARDVPVPDAAWRCIPVGGGEVYEALVDAETGDVVADLQRSELDEISATGCGVELVRGSTRSIVTATAGEPATAVLPPSTRSASLSPDGRQAVVVDNVDRAELILVDDSEGSAEPLDLGELRGEVVLTDR